MYEDVIKAMRDSVVDGLTSPKKFDDITNLYEYAAVFIPGGHGPVIDLNLYPTLGRILRLSHSRDVITICHCHGSNALRSAALERDFPHNGYKIRMFPDSVDDPSSQIGYLPSNP